ncbi:MAG: biotin/lipoyl-binding protein [Sulfurimonas sp.]|nr:biotin/lipoyl-binding protein [Sulfurimonas sp.]
MKKSNQPIEFEEKDYEFMNSLSGAILSRSPSRMSTVIKIWLFSFFAFILWASFASIDEITRGDGDVIPYGQNQIIQNLEGGIVDEILIKEGQTVKAGDVILKIKNAKSFSSSQANAMKSRELEAKSVRLNAEAHDRPYKTNKITLQSELEEQLYNSNKIEFMARDNSLFKQIQQRKQEYKEAQARIRTLKKSLEFVSEEISMTAPMVREGVKSKVDFLKLKREANGIENDIEAASLSLPRLAFAIDEYKSKRREAKQLFINTAKKRVKYCYSGDITTQNGSSRTQ